MAEHPEADETTRSGTTSDNMDVQESTEDLLPTGSAEYMPGLHLAKPPDSGMSGPKYESGAHPRRDPITITMQATQAIDKGYRWLVLSVLLGVVVVGGGLIAVWRWYE